MTAQPRSRQWHARHRVRGRASGIAGLALVALLLLAAVAAPWLAPQRFDAPDFAGAWQFPSRLHPMGTDALGRDVLARVLYGARVSLGIAISAQLASLAIGLPLGAIAGWYGGKLDFLITCVVDVMSAFPALLFAVLVVATLGSSPHTVVLAIGLTGWIRCCRLLRGQILRLREEEYVSAARVLGAGPARIVRVHLLPNALSPLLVATTLGVPFAIFAEAGLSFLGLGATPPYPSWGQMVGESIAYLPFYWYLALFPSLAITLAMLGFTLAADGLHDVIHPATGAMRL